MVNLGDLVTRSARNPLAVFALALVLVYMIAAVVSRSSAFSAQQLTWLVWFLVGYPVVVLIAFVYLVTQHPSKLYAPSDFADEANFVKLVEAQIKRSPKVLELEEVVARVKKMIEEQPLYRYTLLGEEGKRIMLTAAKNGSANILDLVQQGGLDTAALEQEAQRLEADSGWITFESPVATITEKGRRDFATFRDFVYARWG